MLTLEALFAAHLAGESVSLAWCWQITKKNATFLRGTSVDFDLVRSVSPYAGTYKARTPIFSTDVRSVSDGAVSNLEIEGAFRVDAVSSDIRPEDIEAGLYDQAPAVLFFTNWQAPDQGIKIVVRGTCGEWKREASGLYRSEVRSLTQALSQQILRSYSDRCDVKIFGDARCGFDVPAVTRTGVVATVTDRKHFTATLAAGPAPIGATYYNGGLLRFKSGDNNGFTRETQSVTVVGSTATIALWDETPADIAVGNAISLPPGCDRRFSTCRDVHANAVNFRGGGLFAVGKDRLIAGTGQMTRELSVEEFLAAAASWIGVPFHHQGRSRLGVDCAGLPECVLEEADALPRKYRAPRNYGVHPTGELLAALEAWCTVAAAPRPGALLAMRWRPSIEPTHVAIYTGADLIHSYRAARGVVRHRYAEPWISRTAAVWLLPGVRYE